ncbi:hypothetical protein CY34DRAFT_375236 [Suillus luteus UH-Slu-Lm8-n1]|uniref:Uncharacterized protein n=1 Tax=Suillus luteus UH-Slu-Lm8-n1 TaxID=930992 RepID=A0A0C9ZM69_9AGAM|nr:hypothetical protein CY34DRAFT_375236 [Suillus luteus UH-Slu-Lm8-n1]
MEVAKNQVPRSQRFNQASAWTLATVIAVTEPLAPTRLATRTSNHTQELRTSAALLLVLFLRRPLLWFIIQAVILAPPGRGTFY